MHQPSRPISPIGSQSTYHTFAQLSDPHLSSLRGVRAADLLNKRALGYLSWRQRRRFEHRRDILDALQRDLHGTELVQLLVTGDLTHVGLPQEFEQARAWLQQLGEPDRVAVVPGNHDASVRAPWESTFARWRQYMAGDGAAGENSLASIYPSVRVRGDIAFIGLSTACPKPPFMATGTVGAAQLARLPALLECSAAQGLFRVVYLHHCPLPGLEPWRKRLTDAPRVQAVLQAHGAELVLHGHGHRTHCHELDTVHGVAPVIAVPSASAVGNRGNDCAGYNRYRVRRSDTGWLLEVMPRLYRREGQTVVPGATQKISLRR
ncbi:MAG: metallophosphoesterase [Halioglobus sp.]|nr:metallophosphoesterase [Halioglobus sp.]